MEISKPMKKKNIFFIIIFFLLILTVFRLGWMFYHQTPDQPQAENGVIDLTNWEFTDNQAITLDGEWEFYPNEFITPNSDSLNEKKKFISVPGDWSTALSDGDEASPYGYGTYRLKINFPDDEQSHQLYGVRMKEIETAANVYINGQLMAEAGSIAISADESEGFHAPFSALFDSHNNEVELLMHLSNFETPLQGGISNSIQIGTEN